MFPAVPQAHTSVGTFNTSSKQAVRKTGCGTQEGLAWSQHPSILHVQSARESDRGDPEAPPGPEKPLCMGGPPDPRPPRKRLSGSSLRPPSVSPTFQASEDAQGPRLPLCLPCHAAHIPWEDGLPPYNGPQGLGITWAPGSQPVGMQEPWGGLSLSCLLPCHRRP